MCLVSDTRFPRIAKEDIVCYKSLRVIGDAHGLTYYSPILNTEIAINAVNVAKGSSFSLMNPLIKEAGYIHAFTVVPEDRNDPLSKYTMFKAIIPKGTKYHKSLSGMTICAKKMLITDEII